MSPDDGLSGVAALTAAVRDLQRRVAKLEQQLEATSAGAPVFPPASAVADDSLTPHLRPLPAGVLAVLGRALLGIAGAYLLRALVEYGSMPRIVGVAAALAYAGWWLVTSSRVAAENRFTIGVYGITSALIVSPMLWETTVRFQVLPPHVTAAILVLFVLTGLALAWPRNLAVITWITTLAGVTTALALIIATHRLVPFTAALLTIALAVEYTACRDHWLGVRWVVALTADLSLFLMTWLVSRPQGLPEGYAAIPVLLVIAMQIALLSIYLGSMMVRTLVRGLNVRWFEIGQAIVAFLIAVIGGFQVAQRAGIAWKGMGVVCLAGGIACYAVAFAFLEHKTGRHRNFEVYSSFGLLLIGTGTFILLSGFGLALAWSLLAVAGVWVGYRSIRVTPVLHGAAYLLAAVFISGVLAYAAHTMLAPADSSNVPLTGAAVVAAIAGVMCYSATVLNKNVSESWSRHIPPVLFATLLVSIALGFAAGASIAACPAALGLTLDAPSLATLRTALVAASAIVLAWFGWRYGRPELIWLLYPIMFFGGIKLLIEDFRQGRPVTLFLSLLFYGGTLILLPRGARTFRRAQ